MRNSKKNRKGIAIELAILTIAITAIFCTIAVTTTLQESNLMKAELEDLDERCVELKYEKSAKNYCNSRLEAILDKGVVFDKSMSKFTWHDNHVNKVDMTLHKEQNSYKIESWTWKNE